MTKEVKISDKITIYSDGAVTGTNIFEENGYLYIIFEGKRTAIHRLIAQHFINHHISIEGLDVHHIDFNPKNNNVNNLLILTKSRHIALHRYLETPDGYKQLKEDIQTWKDRAEYYRRKAQKIERLNIKMEKALDEQNELLTNWKDSLEKLNKIFNNINNKAEELSSIITDKNKTSNEILEKEYCSIPEKLELCKKCENEYGKVTCKKLEMLGCKNPGPVYQWYRYNVKRYEGGQ